MAPSKTLNPKKRKSDAHIARSMTMIDEGTSRKKNKTKKRKHRSSGEEPEESLQNAPSKNFRTNSPERKYEDPKTEEPKVRMEECSPWRNLQLILSLQNKNIDLQTKLESAFNYVKSRTSSEENDSTRVSETVSLARVLVYMSNWIQIVLISSVKKVKIEESSSQQKDAAICLDYRCWVILKFCLEESVKCNLSLCILRDFLRVIEYISMDALSHLTIESYSSQEPVLSCKEQDLPEIVCKCVCLAFSAHGGVSDENLDLWSMTVCMVLKLLQKVMEDKLDENRAGIFAIELSCYLLEPFANFLRVHPNRKNSYSDFIDRLLDPLMHLLGALYDHTCTGSSGWTQNLLKFVEDVLSQGLFHQTHLEGYMSLQSTDKYKTCDGGKKEVEETVVKSYHRHLFDKLHKVIASKNSLSLGGIAPLFKLFVSCVIKHKGFSNVREGSKHPKGSSASDMLDSAWRRKSDVEEKCHNLDSLGKEGRKSLFDFFVQIMEYFIQQINTFTQDELDIDANWLDMHSVFKSCNKLLERFREEGIYARINDTSEGAWTNFLRLIYESIMSFASSKFSDLLLSSSTSNKGLQEVLILLMKELVLAVHCLFDVEYEVVGNDLGHLWQLMLSFSVRSHSLMGASNHELNSHILHLGCRIIELYKELRQVSPAIFSLCKSLRLLVSSITDCREPFTKRYPLNAKSFCILLCASEFRHSISSAINSIPEGQASGCIQQLTADISDSLKWLKVHYQLAHGNNSSRQGQNENGFQLCLQAELLGRCLSEVYILVLDSMMVTTGNSYAVGLSLKGLMDVIRPSLSTIDSFPSDVGGMLVSFIFGGNPCDGHAIETVQLPEWILLFFFRLYLSHRNLSQQVITLLPPDVSRNMSETFNDSFTALSGNDWLEYDSQRTEGSLFGTIKGSASVLTVIESVSNVCLHNSSTICPPLVYVLCSLALQRLADLNRKLKSFEYLLARRSESIEKKMTGGIQKTLDQRKRKKLTKHILNMKEEAGGLAKFIMSIVEDQLSLRLAEDDYHGNVFFRKLHEDIGWDLSVGALDEKSLPSSIWLVVCQNIDIWSAYAPKKAQKKFLALLMRFSFPDVSGAIGDSESCIMRRLEHQKNASLYQTSRELLNHTVLYEQRFVCRHIASTFCQILETSQSSMFPTLGDIHLKSTPNWAEIVDALETLKNHADDSNYLLMKLSSKSLSRLIGCSCRKEHLAPARNIEYSSSLDFLTFISWMPKGYLSLKSLLLLANCIFNLERILVGSLLGWQGATRREDQCQLLRLLCSCRRILKSLFSSEEKTNNRQFSCVYMLSEGSSSMLWLFKSLAAVIECQHMLSDANASEVEDILFSLMDHTSCILYTVARSLIERGTESYAKDCGGKTCDITDVQSEVPGSTDLVACLLFIGDSLTEDIQNSLTRLKLAYGSEKGVLSDFQNLRKASLVISCVQGFLWGLASGLEITCANSHRTKVGLSKCKVPPLRKLSICIDACTDFTSYFLDLMIIQDDPSCQNVAYAKVMKMSEATQSLFEGNDDFCHDLDEVVLNAESLQNFSPSVGLSSEVNTNYHVGTLEISSKRSSSKRSNVECIVGKDHLYSKQCSKESLLQRLLGGNNIKVAYFLRHLFFASSARLRLKSDNTCTPLLQTLIPILNSIPEYVSVEFASKGGISTPFTYVWLDGVAKFLEELGHCLPSSNPSLSKKSFSRIIELHLRFIAACIVIQGKRATPGFPVSDQINFTPSGQWNLCEAAAPYKTSCLDELKSSLKSSLRLLIQKSSDLHLLAAVQVIERAVLSQEGCINEFSSGISDGGKVLARVAAGVECLGLILELVTGQKRLSVIKSHIGSIAAALFSTIALQGPNIFHENNGAGEGFSGPGSGFVVLTCVEGVTRIFGKRSLFQMDSSHVAQSLHIPAALFLNILQLKLTEADDQSTLKMVSNSGSTHVRNKYIHDQCCSVELYAACCRLLCTVVKHHTSDAQKCAALLEDSVNVLLYCLEMANIDPLVKKGNIAWDVQSGVKCASWLRRVYEEIRQQKDDFGRYCSQFLSCYIWVYNGYGLLKSGFRREIDQTMRPGVYALIDACSADDLQHLHTVFGEGPCRNTLGVLIDDYKVNFHYEGKV